MHERRIGIPLTPAPMPHARQRLTWLAVVAAMIAEDEAVDALWVLSSPGEVLITPAPPGGVAMRIRVDSDATVVDLEAALSEQVPTDAGIITARVAGTMLRLSLDDDRADRIDGGAPNDRASAWIAQARRVLHTCSVDPRLPMSHQLRARDRAWYDEIIRWNDTALPYPPGTISTLFAETVGRRPAHAAVIDVDGTSWRYDQLSRTVDRIANLLASASVRHGDPIVVILERSPMLVAAALAAFKMGAIYIPLDSAGPFARFATGLQAIGARFLLAAQPVALDIENLAFIDIGDARHLPDHFPDVAARDDATAYAMFTSGSTGAPRLVEIGHASLYNQLRWSARSMPLDPRDRVAFKYGIGFDASLSEMLGTVTQGATLVAIDAMDARQADHLLEIVGRAEITVLDLVPSQLDALLSCRDFRRLSRLRRVIVGGEACPAATVRRFRTVSDAELWNAYGPTETTVTAIAARLDCGMVEPVVIGRAVDNMRVYLLDDRGCPVLPGEVGDLWLAGVQVAERRLNGPPDDTDFTADPFRSTGRAYRTGDTGRRLPDGDLVFVGRRDDQLAIRGFRIEPGEVEAALLLSDAVQGCAVGMTRDAKKTLAAWIVARAGATLDPVVIRHELAARLPLHMVPAVFFEVTTLPRTAVGKLDRSALSQIDGNLLRTIDARDTDSPTEIRVAAAFTSLLGIARPDAQTSFFALGGDSLLAMQLVELLAETLGVTLEVADIFDGPSVCAIAARADRLARRSAAPEWRLVPDDGQSRVNANQRRILTDPLAAFLAPTCLAVSWSGPIDLSKLALAFGRTMDRHPSLRMSFALRDGAWRTEPIAPDVEALLHHRRGDKPAGTPPPPGWMAPFDAQAGPLIRLGVDQLADDRATIALAAHPAACDRPSLEIVLRDLSRFYFNLVDGCALPAPLKTTPDDYRRWQEATLAPHRAVPTCDVEDGSAKDTIEATGSAPPLLRLEKTYPQSLACALERTVELLDVDAEALLTNALFEAGQRTGIALPTIGLPVSGRRGLPAIEGLVGCFADYLLVAPPRAETVPGMVRDMQRRITSARNRRGLQSARRTKRDAPVTSWLDRPAIALSYQRVRAMAAGTVALAPLPFIPLGASRALHLDISLFDTSMTCQAVYRSDRFDERQAGVLLDAFHAAMIAVIQDIA